MYRSVLTLTVLSEEDIADREIGHILEACDTGDCVLASTGFDKEEIDGKAMADALYAAGSDPGFFMLDDDGRKVDDE